MTTFKTIHDIQNGNFFIYVHLRPSNKPGDVIRKLINMAHDYGNLQSCEEKQNLLEDYYQLSLKFKHGYDVVDNCEFIMGEFREVLMESGMEHFISSCHLD